MNHLKWNKKINDIRAKVSKGICFLKDFELFLVYVT